MHEAEVAKLIKAGQVPGSGTLAEIAADYTDATKKIDTITSNWAAQVKHSRVLERFDVNDIAGADLAGEAYLSVLKTQAVQAGKLPILITNKPATTELQTLLGQLGIEHRVLPSPFE